jgi:hypothetical protein
MPAPVPQDQIASCANEVEGLYVPRIRSIKPEFFTSETLARVSISARLTFIGLWTYVDDNGVGLDNERLIAAALYPLDDDPLESLRRVSEDLRQLSAAGVIVRYEVSGRRYMFVTNWLEHQKVSHPGKPRFPRPAKDYTPPPTSDDDEPPESLPNDSGNPPETLAKTSALSREQGAGSREGNPPTEAADPAPQQRPDAEIIELFPGAPKPAPATTDELVADWLEHIPKRPPGSVIGRVGKHIKTMLGEGIDPADVRRGVAAWAAKGKDPSALPSIVNEVMNARPGAAVGAPRPSTTDQRVQAGLELAARHGDGTIPTLADMFGTPGREQPA